MPRAAACFPTQAAGCLMLRPLALRQSTRLQITASRHLYFSKAQRQLFYVRFEAGPNGEPSPGRKALEKINLRLLAGVSAIFGLYYVSHLEQVPETGRWRFMNIGPNFDENLGKTMREETLREYRHAMFPPNHPLSLHVRRIVSQLLSASNLGHLRGELTAASSLASYGGEASDELPWNPDAELHSGGSSHDREWDVIVVNAPKVVNAEAGPGFIIVYTGILPVAKDEQGLAAVLSHEMGHVVARHTAERMSAQSITLVLLTAVKWVIGIIGMSDYGITDLVETYLIRLPNSRTQELEADKIGLKLMSHACFDPKNSIDMFQRLNQLEKQQSSIDLSFLTTHPSGARRIEELQKILPEAYAVIAATPECASMHDHLHAFQDSVGRGRKPRKEEFLE